VSDGAQGRVAGSPARPPASSGREASPPPRPPPPAAGGAGLEEHLLPWLPAAVRRSGGWNRRRRLSPELQPGGTRRGNPAHTTSSSLTHTVGTHICTQKHAACMHLMRTRPHVLHTARAPDTRHHIPATRKSHTEHSSHTHRARAHTRDPDTEDARSGRPHLQGLRAQAEHVLQWGGPRTRSRQVPPPPRSQSRPLCASHTLLGALYSQVTSRTQWRRGHGPAPFDEIVNAAAPGVPPVIQA
jgi:hypothetical protein